MPPNEVRRTRKDAAHDKTAKSATSVPQIADVSDVHISPALLVDIWERAFEAGRDAAFNVDRARGF